jgi:hypothetical protein
MDAPRCVMCGTKHWSRQPCPAMGKDERLQQACDGLRQAESVTKKPEIPVTKIQPGVTKAAVDSVTKTPTVTKTKRGRPRLGDKPMSAAERMRRYRARKAPLP